VVVIVSVSHRKDNFKKGELVLVLFFYVSRSINAVKWLSKNIHFRQFTGKLYYLKYH